MPLEVVRAQAAQLDRARPVRILVEGRHGLFRPPVESMPAHETTWTTFQNGQTLTNETVAP